MPVKGRFALFMESAEGYRFWHIGTEAADLRRGPVDGGPSASCREEPSPNGERLAVCDVGAGATQQRPAPAQSGQAVASTCRVADHSAVGRRRPASRSATRIAHRVIASATNATSATLTLTGVVGRPLAPLAEIYRRGPLRRLRAVGQGYDYGLGTLARGYGVTSPTERARPPGEPQYPAGRTSPASYA